MNINEKELKNYLIDFFSIDENILDDDLTFEKINQWDSLKHVKLIINLKDKYKIKINQNEIPNLISFLELKKFLGNYK